MSARRQIIAALSEDSMGGIATLQDVEHAEQLVDAHRAEVLYEAADEAASAARLFPDIDECAAAIGALEGLADRFRRMANQPGEKSSREADATPDFFQPGHTYTTQVGYDTALFHVEHIGRRPGDCERRAFGWYRRLPRTQWHAFSRGETDYAAWADVTGEAS